MDVGSLRSSVTLEAIVAAWSEALTAEAGAEHGVPGSPLAQAADGLFNPASSIKLATAFVALRTFGPNNRFTTGFWTDGAFDKEIGRASCRERV